MDEVFRLPDWDAPLDVSAHLAAAPPDGWVRGMFFREITARARERSSDVPGRASYVAFKTYPLREYMEVLAGCAGILHPDVSLREALRRIGHLTYPTFVSSTVGKVLFAMASDWLAALRIASKAYGIAVRPGRVRVLETGPRTAVVELRNMYSFADAYQVGIFEGAMRAFDRTGEVRVRILALHEVDLLLTWD